MIAVEKSRFCDKLGMEVRWSGSGQQTDEWVFQQASTVVVAEMQRIFVVVPPRFGREGCRKRGEYDKYIGAVLYLIFLLQLILAFIWR